MPLLFSRVSSVETTLVTRRTNTIKDTAISALRTFAEVFNVEQTEQFSMVNIEQDEQPRNPEYIYIYRSTLIFIAR